MTHGRFTVAGGGPVGSLLAILLVLLLVLQFKLWFGDGGLIEVRQLRQAIANRQDENAQLRERNDALEAEVTDLRNGLAAIEERARSELGIQVHRIYIAGCRGKQFDCCLIHDPAIARLLSQGNFLVSKIA